jgi:hypothetical protein
MAALSLETDIERKAPVGQFNAFIDIDKKATVEVKAYFKKFIECINLEQSAEQDR